MCILRVFFCRFHAHTSRCVLVVCMSVCIKLVFFYSFFVCLFFVVSLHTHPACILVVCVSVCIKFFGWSFPCTHIQLVFLVVCVSVCIKCVCLSIHVSLVRGVHNYRILLPVFVVSMHARPACDSVDCVCVCGCLVVQSQLDHPDMTIMVDWALTVSYLSVCPYQFDVWWLCWRYLHHVHVCVCVCGCVHVFLFLSSVLYVIGVLLVQ